MRFAPLATALAAAAAIPAALAPRAARGEAPPCQVTIAQAPADVREVIERWVRAEPRCAAALELRVIPTAGGYLLVGRAGTGQIFQRVVPDAQSAGVLVASWIADDGVADAAAPAGAPPGGAAAPAADPSPPGAAATPPADPAPPGSGAAPATADRAQPAAAPRAPIPRGPGAGGPPGAAAPLGARPGASGPPGSAPAAADLPGSAPPAGRWLTVAALIPAAAASSSGVRAELDVMRRGRWTLAISGAVSTATLRAGGQLRIDTADTRALATLGRTLGSGAWTLRLAGGVGVVHTSALRSTELGELTADGTFPLVETGAAVSRAIGARWALTGGALLSWLGQQMDAPSMGEPVVRGTELNATLGIGRRL
jgi:hypothetical protein